MIGMADISAGYARFHRDELPVLYSSDEKNTGFDDALLPEKTANQKEIDRHAYYFKFADEARTKLASRGLWTEKTPGSGEFEARPDAGERLINSFSKFLTAFVSFGSNNEVEKLNDVFAGIVHYSQGGTSPMMVISGGIFVFNTIVSQLKKIFPEKKTYFDHAGKLTYFSSSAIHSMVSAIQPIVHEAAHLSVDPIFSIVLVSIELLLGFYSTVTATESVLSLQSSKANLLTALINSKAKAESFFQKAQGSGKASLEEVEAYEKFMAVISELDQISAEKRFASLFSAASVAKEWLWFGGAVVKNETAYKHLISTEIAISGTELLGTTLGGMFMALVANIIDVAHGIVVAARCQQKIDHGVKIKKELGAIIKKITSPAMMFILKGVERIIDKKIQDENFEKGFSFFRIFKASLSIAIGIAIVIAIVFPWVYVVPLIIGLIAGVALASFFVFLIAKSLRTAESADDEMQEEEYFKKKHDTSANELINSFTNVMESSGNQFFLLHTLSASLVDMPEFWKKGGEMDLLFAALNFNEIDMSILQNIAQNTKDRVRNIDMVKAQLKRMLDLKMVVA